MSDQLCSPACRCRRCVEILSDHALRKRRAANNRFQARAAGLASGRARRRLAIKRRGRTGIEQHGLSLDYELRRLSRGEFDRRYEALWPYPERPTAAASWERGREAMWTYLGGVYALLSVRGQYCRTTSEQRREHLKGKGIPRCRRTVQRYNAKLAAMGIAKFTGFSRWNPESGWTGYISVQWHLTRRVRILDVTPPPGTGNPVRSSRVPRVQSKSKTRIAPTSSADDEPPDKPAERQSTEDDDRRARIRFLTSWLERPYGDMSAVEAELAQLEAESGPDLARIGASSSRGFRCST